MSPTSVWTRAVVGPAWRRAVGAWLGIGIAGAVVFGPTAMHPSDFTRLALGVPAVGIGFALTWLVVFLPCARVIVRTEPARYLRSLPMPRSPTLAIGAVALVGLQLPWLALWIIGDGVRGLALVLGLTGVIALVATWRLAPRPVRIPRWRGDHAALRGVYLLALRRRASDALLRGAGMAIIAGLLAALVVRNNAVAGVDAAVLGTGVIAIVLLPGWAGALLPLVDAQRMTDGLASSLGMSRATRVATLALVVSIVYVGSAAIAMASATVAFVALFDANEVTRLVALHGTVLGVTVISLALLATRALLHAQRDDKQAGSRVAVGAIGASALAIVALGWLGAFGLVPLAVLGACAILTARTT